MSSLRFRLFVVIVAATASGQAYSAPILWSGNGHYYDLIMPGSAHPANYTWHEARDEAAGMTHLGSSGHLVTVTSAAESQFLFTAFGAQIVPDLRFVGGGRGSIIWIGLNDATTEGSFQWVTGEPFSYSNWLPPEPNNLGDEDYVHYFYRDYGSGPIWGWNDSQPSLASSETVGFFVEYDGPFLAAVPEPLTFFLLGGIAIGLVVRRRFQSRA